MKSHKIGRNGQERTIGAQLRAAKRAINANEEALQALRKKLRYARIQLADLKKAASMNLSVFREERARRNLVRNIWPNIATSPVVKTVAPKIEALIGSFENLEAVRYDVARGAKAAIPGMKSRIGSLKSRISELAK